MAPLLPPKIKKDPNTPATGPYSADGRYISGPGFKALGRAFDTEDQPIETVCATASLWAASWEMLEILKAEAALEERTRAIANPFLPGQYFPTSQAESKSHAEELAALSAEAARLKQARAAIIAKFGGTTQ